MVWIRQSPNVTFKLTWTGRVVLPTEISQFKASTLKVKARKETFINHPFVMLGAGGWERNPVFITPACPYGRAVSTYGRWWRTRVEQGGGAVTAACDWSALAQRELSGLRRCFPPMCVSVLRPGGKPCVTFWWEGLSQEAAMFNATH